MGAIGQIILKYPLFGAAAASLGGGFYTYLWWADRSDPTVVDPLRGIFPIAFWVVAVLLVGLHLFRRNVDQLVKVNTSDALPISDTDRFVFSEHEDQHGFRTFFVFLSTTSEFIVWKLNREGFAKFQKLAQQKLYSTSELKPKLQIPISQVKKLVEVSKSSVVLEYINEVNQNKLKKLEPIGDTESVLVQFRLNGWHHVTQDYSETKRRWELRTNLVVAAVLSLAAVPLLLAYFINNESLLVPWLPISLVATVGVLIGGAFLVTAQGSKEAVTVTPNQNIAESIARQSALAGLKTS